MKYTIEQKEVGKILRIEGDMEEYVALEYHNQGWFYKDSEAFEKGFGVCYIPEYAVEEFGGKMVEIEGENFYRLIDIEDTYSYTDFLNLTHNNHIKAKALFELLDWQYPQSLYQELEEMEDLFEEEEME
jgi:hypothetical protein